MAEAFSLGVDGPRLGGSIVDRCAASGEAARGVRTAGSGGGCRPGRGGDPRGGAGAVGAARLWAAVFAGVGDEVAGVGGAGDGELSEDGVPAVGFGDVEAQGAAVGEALARGRLPLVVGGTGFYIRALAEGLPTAPPASTRQDMNTRASGSAVRANAPIETKADR